MMNPEDQSLLKDFDWLVLRVNSEIGVPMLLACENLFPEGAARVWDNSLNREFASDFQHDVERVQRMRPDASLIEIAKIVERLAEEEFGSPSDGMAS